MKMLRVVLISLLATAALSAQTQAINGSIRGRVTDPTGAAVPQAKVTVANADTGFTRSADSSEDGYFVFPNLPLGSYTITVQRTGFDTQKYTGVALAAGVEGVIDAQLKVGAVSTTVEVTGGAAVIEPSRVNTGRTITQEEINNLPLPSRNPYNFVLFQPGVSGHPNPELGIPRTINTNGLLDRINYQMDGMVGTQSDRYGIRLFPISDIYVREVQTVSNSFAPEFGNTAGIIYNVITNSGSNTPHGEFSFIGRPTNAFARPILLGANRPAPIIDVHDYAFNLGGPVKKDRLFLFGGYEHLLRGLPSANTIDQSLATQIGINPALLATAPSVQHVQFLNLRADWIINDKHQVFARYNYFRNEFPFNTAVGGLNALDVAADFRDRAHVVGLQLLSTFSSNLLNELRASEPYRNQTHTANPLNGPGPQVVITGIATFNGTSAIGDRFAEKIPSVSDSVTWLKGRHTMKAGFGFQQNNDNQVGNVFSRYNFSSIANYLAAKNGTNPLSYASFVTVLGVPGLSYKTNFYNFFVQDSWQLKPNFLLIYGVRYDRYQPPDANPNAPFIFSREFRSPGGNFAPRLGFAWQMRPKFVLRVNSGIFYEAPATNLWYNALNNDGSPRSFQTTLAPTAANAPRFPNVFSGSATFPTPSPTGVTPNFKNAYTFNTSIQIEREFSPNDSLKVGYVHTAARNMVFLRNYNLINPTSFLADGRPVFSGTVSAATRLFPQFNGITFQDIGAISDYNALVVYYQHRVRRGFLVSASYTWSHSISDAPDVNSFEQNAFISDTTNRTRDRGNPVSNRPSALLLSSVINPTVKLDSRFWNALANGNMLTFLANLASGDQQNITTGTLLNGDSLASASQRPLFIGRGTARTKGLYQVDARYTRTIFSYRERLHARVLAEATNLFNRKNVTVINTTAATNAAGVITTAPTFAPVSSVLESRILQLGLKIDF